MPCFRSQKGHNCAHIAAAFGALDCLRMLYAKGPELFGQENAAKKTPLEVAQHIGEEDAVLLIEALLAGKDDSTIGLGKDLDLEDEATEPMPSAPAAEPPQVPAEAGKVS